MAWGFYWNTRITNTKFIHMEKGAKKMKRKTGLVVLLAGLVISSCAYLPGITQTQNEVGYKTINVEDLNELMNKEDFTLINVHIPLDGNIPGTDLEIPFNDVKSYLEVLPGSKDGKIIIYCRSGGMGDVASQTLVDLGYTDVSNLEGGYNAWKATGLPFEE